MARKRKSLKELYTSDKKPIGKSIEEADSIREVFNNPNLIFELQTDDIIVDLKKNIRKKYSETSLQRLSVSIIQNEQLQPVGVIIVNGKYRLIFGYRRYLAIRKYSGDQTIRVLVFDKDVDIHLLQIVENFQREDPNNYDLSVWLQSLKDKNKCNNSDLASIVSKSKSWVDNKLQHLKEVETSLLTEKEKESVKELSTDIIRPIATLSKAEKSKLLKEFIKTKPTVKVARKRAKEVKEQSGDQKKKSEQSAQIEPEQKIELDQKKTDTKVIFKTEIIAKVEKFIKSVGSDLKNKSANTILLVHEILQNETSSFWGNNNYETERADIETIFKLYEFLKDMRLNIDNCSDVLACMGEIADILNKEVKRLSKMESKKRDLSSAKADE